MVASARNSISISVSLDGASPQKAYSLSALDPLACLSTPSIRAEWQDYALLSIATSAGRPVIRVPGCSQRIRELHIPGARRIQFENGAGDR